MLETVKRRAVALCGSLLLLAAAAASASAEPLVITSGTINGCPSCVDEVHTGSFFGGGFRFGGTAESFIAQPLAAVGGTISVNARASFGGNQFYTAGSGSSGYYVGRASVLLFSSASVLVPAGSDAPTLFIDVPFTVSGTIFLTDEIRRDTPPVFTFEVSGAGIARITLASIGEGLYVVRDVRYDFQSPEAVPEPTTVALLGTGLAAALLRRRKRRAAPPAA